MYLTSTGAAVSLVEASSLVFVDLFEEEMVELVGGDRSNAEWYVSGDRAGTDILESVEKTYAKEELTIECSGSIVEQWRYGRGEIVRHAVVIKRMDL